MGATLTRHTALEARKDSRMSGKHDSMSVTAAGAEVLR